MASYSIDQKFVAGRACSHGRDLGYVSIGVRNGRIASIEKGIRRDAFLVDEHFWIAPGLIDLQINGGFGHDLLSDPRSVFAIQAKLPATGVLAFLPTLPSPTESAALELAAAICEPAARQNPDPEAAPAAEILGIHLEGPLLNPSRAGAHPENRLLDGKGALRLFRRVLATGRSAQNPRRDIVRMVTLAPEMDGAFALAAAAARSGAVVAAGHTDADYFRGLSAIEAGIRTFTHVFNASRPIRHRDPGILTAYLLSDHTYLTLISDGVHVSEPVVKLIARLAGVDRIALVTDAVAGMGAEEKKTRRKKRNFGAAKDDSGLLLGGTTPLASCVSNFASFAGVEFPKAIQSATGVPARILGLRDRGRLAKRVRSEMIAIAEDGNVGAIVKGGRLVELIPGAVSPPRRISRRERSRFLRPNSE